MHKAHSHTSHSGLQVKIHFLNMFSLIEEMLFTNAKLCSSNLNYAREPNSSLEKGYFKHFTKIHEQSLRCLISSNK